MDVRDLQKLPAYVRGLYLSLERTGPLARLLNDIVESMSETDVTMLYALMCKFPSSLKHEVWEALQVAPAPITDSDRLDDAAWEFQLKHPSPDDPIWMEIVGRIFIHAAQVDRVEAAKSDSQRLDEALARVGRRKSSKPSTARIDEFRDALSSPPKTVDGWIGFCQTLLLAGNSAHTWEIRQLASLVDHTPILSNLLRHSASGYEKEVVEVCDVYSARVNEGARAGKIDEDEQQLMLLWIDTVRCLVLYQMCPLVFYDRAKLILASPLDELFRPKARMRLCS